MPRTLFRTYDDWKTASPEDDLSKVTRGDLRNLTEKTSYPDCDVCQRPNDKLRQIWVHNIETWACAECLGDEPEE